LQDGQGSDAAPCPFDPAPARRQGHTMFRARSADTRCRGGAHESNSRKRWWRDWAVGSFEIDRDALAPVDENRPRRSSMPWVVVGVFMAIEHRVRANRRQRQSSCSRRSGGTYRPGRGSRLRLARRSTRNEVRRRRFLGLFWIAVAPARAPDAARRRMSHSQEW